MRIKTGQHTFLFREGLWQADGHYYDAQRNLLINEGRSVITHMQDVWINEGYMRIKADTPLEFQNRYEIEPFKPGMDHTVWKSLNPDLSPLTGKFVIVEDAIISTFTSEDGQFNGTEVLVQVSEKEYRSRGCLFMHDQRLSSWAVRLLFKS